MQVPGVENLAWNGRYADWGDSAWKSDGPTMAASRGWFEHPSDAESTLQSFDTYQHWQAQTGNNVFGDCSGQQMMYGASSEHDGGQGSIWGAAGGGGLVNPAPSQFGQAANPWSTAPAVREHQHASSYGAGDHAIQLLARGSNGFNGFNNGQMSGNHNMGQPQAGMYSTSPAGSNMMSNGMASNHGSGLPSTSASSDGRYEAGAAAPAASQRQPSTRDDSDDEDDDRTPKEATQEEKEEAEEVVRLAFKEAKERKRLREKVKDASPADLQALLNARFAKKSAERRPS